MFYGNSISLSPFRLAVCIPPCMNGQCKRPNYCECKKGFKGAQCEIGKFCPFFLVFLVTERYNMQVKV